MAGEYRGFGLQSRPGAYSCGRPCQLQGPASPQEQERDLAKRFPEKTNQRPHAFLGQLVIRVRGGGRFDNDGQAVD